VFKAQTKPRGLRFSEKILLGNLHLQIEERDIDHKKREHSAKTDF